MNYPFNRNLWLWKQKTRFNFTWNHWGLFPPWGNLYHQTWNPEETSDIKLISSYVCFTWEITGARHLPARGEATWPDETVHFLARTARLAGTHTGNRFSKWSQWMCAWTGYTLRSVPPRQLSPWEQYHLSLRATRQWRPDGEQRVEDGTKCRPKWGHQIKFFSYSWCQEPMVLLFITVCMGNTVRGHLSFFLFLNPLFLHIFVRLSLSLFDTCTVHTWATWYDQMMLSWKQSWKKKTFTATSLAQRHFYGHYIIKKTWDVENKPES